MLVLRKEIKIGIGAGLTILGIAGVYGLMASLSGNGADHADQSAVVTTDDKGLDSASPGLPPKDETPAATTPPKLVDASNATDPFSESKRTDGNLSNDAILSALATGRIGDAKVKDASKPANGSTSGSDPMVIKAPTTPKTESQLVNSHDTNHDATASNGSAAKTSVPANGTKYVIKPGDTFSTISEKMYGSKKYAQSLVKANPDVNPTRLKIGKEITVPPKEQVATIGGSFDTARTVLSAPIDATRQYRVAPGDTLSHISQKLYGRSTKWQAIYEANKAVIGADEARLKVGMLLDLPEKPVR